MELQNGLQTDIYNGLLFGLLFGFFLQRGQILRFDRQLGLMRLTDMTVLKFMLSAAFTAMVGLQLCQDLLHLELQPRPVFVMSIVVGGLVYGIGWAIAGYCPGTLLGAIGEGRVDAVWVLLGGWVGAFAYVWIHPLSQRYINPVLSFRSVDLDTVLHLNPWLVIAALGVMFALVCWWLERRK